MMDDTLHYSLMITNSKILKEILRRAAQLGLSPGQPKVLEYLNEHDGCSCIDISRGYEIDKSTVTGILYRMEQKGLIRSACDPHDKRKTLIFTTEKGKEAYQLMKLVFEETDEASMKGISQKEREIFLSILSKIKQNASF